MSVERGGQELTGMEDNRDDCLDGALQTFSCLLLPLIFMSVVRQGVQFVEELWSVT